MTARDRLRLAILLLAALPVYTWGIARPFFGHAESCATQVGMLSRNFLKFGYASTRGGVLDVSGPELDAYGDHRRYFYTSHPPLVYWVSSLCLRLFGVREWSVRLVPVGFALVAVVLFHLLARQVTPTVAWLATLFFAFNPMFAYMSRATVHLVVVLTWVLLGLLLYLGWRRTGSRRMLAGLLLVQAIACYTDWQGYYLASVLFAHLLATDPRRWRWGVLFLGVNFAVFGLYLLHLYALEPRQGAALRFLFEVGTGRTGVSLEALPRYVFSEAREIGLYFTVGMVLLALPGLAWSLRRGADRLVPCLLLLGLDEILFIPYASGHDYLTYCLAPFFALAAARGLAVLGSPGAHRFSRPAAAFLLAAFAIQSAWVLYNRVTSARVTPHGGYEFYYRLAEAIREATRPEDRLLLLTDDIRFYTPFYADRYVLWYDRHGSQLLEQNSGPRWPVSSEEEILELIRRNPRGLDWAVTAEERGIRATVRYLQDSDNETLRAFGVEPEESEITRALRETCGPPRSAWGFLFWEFP